MDTAMEVPKDPDGEEGKDVTKPAEGGGAFQPAPPAAKFFSIVPTNMKEAMDFAKMVSDSDMVPKDYKGKPGNCLIAMQYGAELGLPPLQAIQNIAVINGKPGIYGDLGKAMLHSKGFKVEERDVPEVKAKGQAWCKVTRPNGEAAERTFSIDDAKTAGLWGKQGPWTQYPYRQMAWRAFWFAARDKAGDVLKGLWGVEELQDFKRDAIETTAEPMPKRLSEKKGTAAEPTPENPAVDVAAAGESPKVEMVTPEEQKHIFDLLKTHKVKQEELKAHLLEEYKITGTYQLPRGAYGEVCEWIATTQEEIPFGG